MFKHSMLLVLIMTIYILNVNGNKFLDQPVRDDGKCGKYNGNAGCNKPNCCSQYGFCGSESLHCNWNGYYTNQDDIKECLNDSCNENFNEKDAYVVTVIMNNLIYIFISLGIGVILIIIIIYCLNKTRPLSYQIDDFDMSNYINQTSKIEFDNKRYNELKSISNESK